MTTFDYHREMTGAVMELLPSEAKRAVWIMNEEHLEAYRLFQEREMGVVPDITESWGIPIEVGEPADGAPFELRLRAPE